MRFKLLFIALSIFTSCKQHVKPEAVSEKTAISKVEDVNLNIYDYDGLEPLLNQQDNKIHVVNFWATWCGPCVKELPYFEAVGNKYANKNVEVLLVSLDFPHQYDTKLKPFIVEHKIKSEVVVLDDVDMNTWIPKVNPDWSGAIPATIIYKENKRVFFERSFTQDELETELKPFLE
ncbi:MAG: TlpA family protein disulfide reductase [Flavobacteriaceae bacterium]